MSLPANLDEMTVAELDDLCSNLQSECRRPLNAFTATQSARELDVAVAAYRAAIMRDGTGQGPIE